MAVKILKNIFATCISDKILLMSDGVENQAGGGDMPFLNKGTLDVLCILNGEEVGGGLLSRGQTETKQRGTTHLT